MDLTKKPVDYTRVDVENFVRPPQEGAPTTKKSALKGSAPREITIKTNDDNNDKFELDTPSETQKVAHHKTAEVRSYFINDDDEEELGPEAQKRAYNSKHNDQNVQTALENYRKALTTWRTPRQWFLDLIGSPNSNRALAKVAYENVTGYDPERDLSKFVQVAVKESYKKGDRRQGAGTVIKRRNRRTAKDSESEQFKRMRKGDTFGRIALKLEARKIANMSAEELEQDAKNRREQPPKLITIEEIHAEMAREAAAAAEEKAPST